MHTCPHCRQAISPQDSICPHCKKEIDSHFVDVPSTEVSSEHRREFVKGFLTAFIVSCVLPVFRVGGAILSGIAGLSVLSERPYFGKGLLLGALAGVFGAWAVCVSPWLLR